MRKKRQASSNDSPKEELQKKKDEILGLHINSKNLEDMELTAHQKDLVAEISKFWLVKHNCKTINLNGGGDHYGIYATIGIILGLIAMLTILYFIPV